MRKKTFFSISILMLGLAAYALYLYNKPHTSVAAIAPTFTIDADELYTAFEKNETDASTKFIDKVILVKGKVSDVTSTDSTLTIVLESNSIAGGISCNFIAENAISKTIKAGDPLSIKGRCTGYLADVMLADCAIEK